MDNFTDGYEATKHLIELGHTEIAHIRGPEPFLRSKERELGYIHAMKDAGLHDVWIQASDFSIFLLDIHRFRLES
ncbi:type 1 periplasmic-binding domain-containing protein [Paenibacillus roseipurpureus]|uniref:Periplasmic binding protein/LacI sugar binding domain-containing protein n=1 Tax=Paenibacillus roseopurpureus TaxID=2918901 RepID=A0AA96RMM4_9BACL|nr:hypothetical protein [Paenibacillus sp. MBLB1832]WNR46519.1 hypothetical protein MJB10_10645 [Paenibacillus sp. MBLB1832]